MGLTEYTIGKEFAIPAGFSSSGIQAKYYKDGFWYKKNRDGYEGQAEQICSDVLSFTNIQDYVPYEACRINGVSGCRSRNFLNPDTETFISFETAYRYAYGRELSDLLYTLQNPEDRIKLRLISLKIIRGWTARSIYARY